MQLLQKNIDRNSQELPLVLDAKDAYRQMRNYLAGQCIGATRDEALLEEVVKCLFSKIYIKKHLSNTSFINGDTTLTNRYEKAYSEVRNLLPIMFRKNEGVMLDPSSLDYVDRMLDFVELNNPNRDPIGDAYEAFIGSHIRGQEGQFFTPQNAVELLVSMVNPQPEEKIIDPACGAGGFLSLASRYLLSQGDLPQNIAKNIFGIDKDHYLSELASSHLSIFTLEPAKVFCADSLAWKVIDGQNFPVKDLLGSFDVVLTNPPFGSKIVSVSKEAQKSFELGFRWHFDSKSRRFCKSNEPLPSVPPQVLFIERCISLVRPGGRIGMVVPESLISGKNYRYVVQYIRTHTILKAVLGMPESLFKTSGKGGTHTKTCLIILEKRKEMNESVAKKRNIFMAEARWCGHDSRGRTIHHDELSEIGVKFREFREGRLKEDNHLGYLISQNQIINNILAPRYYNPDVAAELEYLSHDHDLLPLGELIESGVIQVTSGDEVGKLVYGSGSVPFVRTSDISNWEIKIDPKHCVSEDVYQRLARKQDIRETDILMVRDGTYLIGTCAFITKYDTRIVFQSHLYKLRVMDKSRISPYLLLASLSSPPVQHQIKAKCFTQDIIDSLGSRINELILPIPKKKSDRKRIERMVKRAIEQRVKARELARRACLEMVGQDYREEQNKRRNGQDNYRTLKRE